MPHRQAILFLLCLLSVAPTEARARCFNPAPAQRPVATNTPGEILRNARTLVIRPGRAVDAKYLQYKLLRTDTLADWNISIVEDPRAADLLLTVEQVRLNYIFRITDPQTSMVIVSGKVVAINDPVAAEFLGKEIIKRMREVRGAN